VPGRAKPVWPSCAQPQQNQIEDSGVGQAKLGQQRVVGGGAVRAISERWGPEWKQAWARALSQQGNGAGIRALLDGSSAASQRSSAEQHITPLPGQVVGRPAGE